MMNYSNLKTVVALSILLCKFLLCQSQSVPLKAFDNQSDYSFMWWKKTIKTGNQVFAIKTNNYTLGFDYPNLLIQDFSINKSKSSEDAVLRETNKESFPFNNPIKFRFGTSISNTITWCEKTSGIDDDCQLVETGKYFQRRFITNLPDLKNFSKYNSGLEISSWPDRISFIFKAIPNRNIENLGLLMELTLPEEYNVLIEKGAVKALKNPKDGSGYIIFKSNGTSHISINGTTVKIGLNKILRTEKGTEINAGMVIYPISENIDLKLKQIVDLENTPLRVTAKQISPIDIPLRVNYDKSKGWHQISLRNDATKSVEPVIDATEINPGPQDDLNNRMERVVFSVTNPSDSDKVIRLNFAKGRLVKDGASVFAIPGISAVLRDFDGNSLGIPIQLSKNWHTGGRSGADDHYFRGTWYHGLTMFTVPANTSVSMEYTSINSLWGGVPAASHAQLCLIGWGSNQQWDQSAIGAWGENITYEPDLDQASAPVLDFRPLFVKSKIGEKWGWTGNLGGADILNYTKKNGNRAWHSSIKTQYKRYSPNITEVTYAGTMDDNSMDFEYTASIARSDDMIRGFYKIKLKVLKNVDFNDFVVFQAAAPTYHYTVSNTLAWGNEKGLKKEWLATIGNTAKYTTAKQVAQGKTPWFSFTNSEFTSSENHFLPANRGFIIRKWNAKINGHENVLPWFAEYNAIIGHGKSSGIINITPPNVCTSFKEGDFIEAEIELFIIPSSADDYYGPNINFANALKAKANSWEMVYREAIGNNIDVNVTKGKLVDNYPIKIEAEEGKVEISLTGGLGYVPLTITNVLSYKNPELFRKENGEWKIVNQEVHGNDFWQTEYNATNGTWDISFNINLDSPKDRRRNLDFKFVTLSN